MVALKHGGQVSQVPNECPKQERRGGIETGPSRSLLGARSAKQERRGGIETETISGPGCGTAEGSRNAVVALKLHRLLPGMKPLALEAGTPWWH